MGVLTCLLEMQQHQGKLGLDKQDLNYSSLMWQCASTLHRVKTIIQRANLNSIKYYKITPIDGNRTMSVTEDMTIQNENMKKEAEDVSVESDHSFDQFDLNHQLDEDCQMIDEELDYPSYPVHFY